MSGPREGAVLEVPNRLSYSQVSKYSECGEKYRLEYGRGIKGHNWYATVAGKVIHEITELRDRNRWLLEVGRPHDMHLVPDFKTAFLAAVAEEESRGVTLKASGKALLELGWTGGPNKKDKEWWLKYGPEIPVLYERWRNESQWEIAMVPNAEGEMIPAIELEFKLEIGGEPVVGYIDRVFWDPINQYYVIIDIKTGNLPVGKLQLGDYRVGLKEQYGIDAPFGAYWSVSQPKGGVTTEVEEPVLDDDGKPILWKSGPRKGQPKVTVVKTTVPAELQGQVSSPVSLQAWSKEFMEARYSMARDGVMAGVFMPNVTQMCRGCSVRKYCAAVGGDFAVKVPVREEFITLRAPKKEEVVVEEDLTSVE